MFNSNPQKIKQVLYLNHSNSIMKHLFATSLIALGVAAAAYGQSANVQIVHNCPSPVAQTVDIYVGNSKAFAGFRFREATPYLSLPAGLPLQIRIKPASAVSDTNNPLWYRSLTLAPNSNTIAVATGNVGAGFAPNPDNISTAFDVVLLEGRQASTTAGVAQLRILHGAPDAPTVRVKVSPNGPVLVPQAAFRQSSGWLDAPAQDLNVDVDAAAGGATVATFGAPLSAFRDSALLVMASGYLAPAANNNGPAFGLLAVTKGGRAILLPARTTGALQIIHNCPAPAANAVDVYVNGAKAVPDFRFRQATPYLNLPALTPLRVLITPARATVDTTGAVWAATLRLTGGTESIAMAVGNLGTGFAPNPDNVSTAFDVLLLDGRQRSTTAGSAQIRVVHGAPDAPTVRVKVNPNGPTLVPQAAFKQASGWLDAPAANLAVDVDAFASGATVATFGAPLAAFADSALVVMASGYLTPTANNNGPAFGLVVITKSGRAVALPLSLRAPRALPLQLAPNPAQGQVRLVLPQGTTAAVTAFDANGKLAGNLPYNGATVDVSSLTPGMYQLRAQVSDGTVYQARLVRE